jgi:hypothetical protein
MTQDATSSSKRAALTSAAWWIDRGGLPGILTLFVYLWLAPSYIVDGDNAEFATLGTIGGTAHPTGYPLYLVMLRATQWLPGASPAHTAAITTALIAAGSVVLIHAACRAWGARPLAATVVVVVFAASPIAVRIGTRAEVFALNNLIVAAVLWIAATGGPLRGSSRAGVLGLLAGLGMANHMTCTLLAPVGLWAVYRSGQEGSYARALVFSGLGYAIGMSPYVYLFLTPETPMSWGRVRDLDDLFGMITRRDYGGPGAFMPTGGTDVSWHEHQVALLATCGRTWLWVLLPVGLATLVARTIRSTDGREDAWGWRMLAVSWLVMGPLLASRFDIPPNGLGLYVVQRFHVLPALVLAIPTAVGLSSVFDKHRWRVRRSQPVAVAVATLGFAAAIATTLPHLARVHTPAVEKYARNVLGSLPPDAVLFAGQDDQYFGIGYVQWALGVRQDVTFVAWQLTGVPWYGQRLARRGVFAPEGDAPALVRVIEYLHGTGRPVFFELARRPAPTAELAARYPTYPYGPLIHVLPRGTQPPPIDEVARQNAALYEAFDLNYSPPGDSDEFATTIHHRYAATWKTLASTYAAVGRHDAAAWATAMAEKLAPRPGR